MPNTFPEVLDEIVFDLMIEYKELIDALYPPDVVLEGFLRNSFARLTPEQQMNIVQQMGSEWYVKLATRLNKQQQRIDG